VRYPRPAERKEKAIWVDEGGQLRTKGGKYAGKAHLPSGKKLEEFGKYDSWFWYQGRTEQLHATMMVIFFRHEEVREKGGGEEEISFEIEEGEVVVRQNKGRRKGSRKRLRGGEEGYERTVRIGRMRIPGEGEDIEAWIKEIEKEGQGVIEVLYGGDKDFKRSYLVEILVLLPPGARYRREAWRGMTKEEIEGQESMLPF
jgi:hypothetical protein